MSAEQWGRPLKFLSTSLVVIASAFGAGYFLSGATAESIPAWLFLLFVVMGVNFAAVIVVSLSGMIKAVRESRAGYSTTAGLYPELPQLDSRTGELLKTPEERAKHLANGR
ncbi:hypothetical protein [Agromyces sp. Marseille-P2726]|uniref:hypothetical protein n=1 Tax=Agromyces sp. Marseille-P2726 TaxID=2709132 RepID=UPI001C2D5D43|nr:hypothetical protein [Agromyces sp. Marseille-P2726]